MEALRRATMKLFASILLTLSLAAAAAAQTITAYSVTDLALNVKSANTYSATVSITNRPHATLPAGSAVLNNGAAITITTQNCTHVPVKGETGIITGRAGSADRTLLFSNGGSCAVINVVPAK
jgi:hypothetical protein